MRSIAERISATERPAASICIASRATSMQIFQVRPCVSHSGRPSAARADTKQSSLSLWPLRSHPQKHGTYRITSGRRAANSYIARTTSGAAAASGDMGIGGSGPRYPTCGVGGGVAVGAGVGSGR